MRRNDVEDDELFRRELIAHGVPVRDAHPVPGDDARAVLELARILALPQGKPPVRPRPRLGFVGPRSVRLGFPVMAATLAALVAMFVVIVQPVGDGNGAQAATPPLLRLGGVEPETLPLAGEPAAETLRFLAARALDLPYDHAQPVQHVLVDSWLSESGGATSAPAHTVLRAVRRATYYAPDDTVRNIEWRGEPLDQAGRVTSAGGDGPRLSDESFPMPDPGAGHADNLSTAPAVLREELLDGLDAETLTTTPGGALLSQVATLASTYVLPPELVSALWEVLAEEAGVTLLGTTEDRRGRDALVLSAPAMDGHHQQLLLADPDTGAVLGDELVLVQATDAYSFAPPAVTSFNTIVRAERIAVGELPSPTE